MFFYLLIPNTTLIIFSQYQLLVKITFSVNISDSCYGFVHLCITTIIIIIYSYCLYLPIDFLRALWVLQLEHFICENTKFFFILICRFFLFKKIYNIIWQQKFRSEEK